jgi:ABC-2 type transport system permease protein
VSAAAAIAGRELRAYFLSPGGYVVAALYLLLNGIFFVRLVFNQGDVAALRVIFAINMYVFALICPAVTMRMISEEVRLGTIEMLMTSPVRTAEIVLGKFAAALGFLVLLLLPTLVFVAALEVYGRPDYGELACGYLGVILAGSAYLASGMLASSLTASQVVAYLITVFFWLILLLSAGLLPQAQFLPAAWREAWSGVLFGLDPSLRLRDFAIGLIDSSDIVYFCSLTALLLIAAVKSLDVRRWR